MQFIETGQTADILSTEAPLEAADRALATSDTSGLDVLLYQAGHLLAGVATDPCQVALYPALVSLLPRSR